MIQKLVKKYTNMCRKINYRKKIRNTKNHPNKRSTGPDVIIGTPMDMARANVINQVSNDIANTLGTISNKSAEDFISDIRMVVFNISTVLVITFIIYLVLALFNLLQIVQITAAVRAVISILLGILPGLAIRLTLVRKDVKLTEKLQTKFNNGSVDEIDFAMQHLNHIQENIRRISLLLVANIISGSPGKAIKYSSYEPDEIGEVLVEAIPKVDEETAEYLLESISWLSRDYPTAIKPYASRFKELLKVDSTPIQCHSVEILGNIGRTSSKKPAYVNAVKPAVSDDDSDVRKSAVSALGKLPCKESLELLEKLSADTNPTVRKQATNTIQQMTN